MREERKGIGRTQPPADSQAILPPTHTYWPLPMHQTLSSASKFAPGPCHPLHCSAVGTHWEPEFGGQGDSWRFPWAWMAPFTSPAETVSSPASSLGAGPSCCLLVWDLVPSCSSLRDLAVWDCSGLVVWTCTAQPQHQQSGVPQGPCCYRQVKTHLTGSLWVP